jgi:hypothetical protein
MFRQDCTCPALLEDRKPAFPIRGCHPLRPAFPDGSGTRSPATGLVRFRSPLLAESRLMSFPPATEMFQFAGFASQPYGFRLGSRMRGGLPHSETPGSKSARLSSGLIAACHVLHRLLAPRHPPDALTLRLIAKLVVRRDKPRELFPSRVKTLSNEPAATEPVTHHRSPASRRSIILLKGDLRRRIRRYNFEHQLSDTPSSLVKEPGA